jgi:hypothetical protein
MVGLALAHLDLLSSPSASTLLRAFWRFFFDERSLNQIVS